MNWLSFAVGMWSFLRVIGDVLLALFLVALPLCIWGIMLRRSEAWQIGRTSSDSMRARLHILQLEHENSNYDKLIQQLEEKEKV